jgi:hypothetical protein
MFSFLQVSLSKVYMHVSPISVDSLPIILLDLINLMVFGDEYKL